MAILSRVHWALVLAAAIGVFVLLETALRWLVGLGLETDFYGSIPRESVRERQAHHGLRVATGPGWAHLGWVADPERPRVAGPWRLLFRPERAGSYVNDHAIFRDAQGRYRLLDITGRGRGDYRRERRFAQASPGAVAGSRGWTSTSRSTSRSGSTRARAALAPGERAQLGVRVHRVAPARAAPLAARHPTAPDRSVR